MMQLFMIVIQFILNSFKDDSKKKTGLDQKTLNTALSQDSRQLAKNGVNVQSLLQSLYAINDKNKNLAQVKKYTSLQGKIFGYERDKTTFNQYSNTAQASGTTSVASPTTPIATTTIEKVAGKLNLVFPFPTNFFGYVDVPTLPRKILLPIGPYQQAKLIEGVEGYLFYFGSAGMPTPTGGPTTIQNANQFFYDCIAFFQRASIGTTKFKEISGLAINFEPKDVISVCRKICDIVAGVANGNNKEIQFYKDAYESIANMIDVTKISVIVTNESDTFQFVVDKPNYIKIN